MESENLNNMLEKFEDNLSIISCDIDKITTLSKLLNKILSDNTDFEQKDSLNVCSAFGSGTPCPEPKNAGT